MNLNAAEQLHGIVLYPNKIMRTPAPPVGDVGPQIVRLVDLMTLAMHRAEGIGLAAPQIGVEASVAVIDARDGEGLRVFINPQIVDARGEKFYPEGCLSLPGIRETVRRTEYVRARARGLDGEWFDTGLVTGLLAHALQHEVDHLEGRCFVDRLDRTTRRLAIRKHEQIQRTLNAKRAIGDSRR
jgi:peptide deformylase